MNKNTAQVKHKRSRGFSLIELLVASFILIVGVLGAGLMMLIGMSRDNANRVDTTATNAAQTVLEQIASQSANLNTSLPLTDCINTDITTTPLSINTAVGGSPLTTTGDIDFTQAAVTGYQMTYTVCGTNGMQIAYDIRWNITAVKTGGLGKVATVSARQPFIAGTQNIGKIQPVTLRTVVGI